MNNPRLWAFLMTEAEARRTSNDSGDERQRTVRKVETEVVGIFLFSICKNSAAWNVFVCVCMCVCMCVCVSECVCVCVSVCVCE